MRIRIGLSMLLVATFVGLVPGLATAGAADDNSFFVSGQVGGGLNLGEGGGFGLNLAPRVLYFPVKSIGVGGEAGFGFYSESNYSSLDLAIGPRVAYFLKFERRRYPRSCCLSPWMGSDAMWMPYGGLSILFLMRSSKFGNTTSSATGYRARIGAGVAPRIGDRGTAFLELGFETSKMSGGGSVHSGSTGSRIYLEGGFGAFLFR
ncbi:MAG: hypothetical protein ABIL25_04895 [candidate division WOR-3 bacterium]